MEYCVNIHIHKIENLPIYDLLFSFNNSLCWRAWPENLPLYSATSSLFNYITQEICLCFRPSVSWDPAKQKEFSVMPIELKAIYQQLSLSQDVKSTKILIAIWELKLRVVEWYRFQIIQQLQCWLLFASGKKMVYFPPECSFPIDLIFFLSHFRAFKKLI